MFNKQDGTIFSKRIKALRGAKTMAQFGSPINTKVSTISAWENGNVIPSADKLIEISQAYNISVDYLLGLTTNATINKIDKPDVQMYKGGKSTAPSAILGYFNDEIRCEAT